MEDRPERIAHVVGKINTAGGVEAVVNNYYRNIDHSKYQFDYFIDEDSNGKPPQELIDMGARYYIVPPYQKLPQHMKALIGYFKKNNYKIVHSGMNTLAPFSLCAAWIAGVPIRINHNHSTASRGETKRNILKYTLRPFAKVFATDYAACSRQAGEWLFGKKTVSKGKVTIFNNAIDLKRYRFNPEKRAEVRKKLGIEDKFVVGHVGRFCFQKNHKFLIEVFEEVYKRDEDTVLLLVGIGGLMGEIKKLVLSKGLDDAVIFLGDRNDVNELYQGMDVFVLPSFYEGLPVVGVEAQTSGLPCVFSNSMTSETKASEYVQFLPLEDSQKVWAEKVLKMKGFAREDMTENIRQAGFDITVEAKKMAKFYADKLGNYKLFSSEETKKFKTVT